MIEFPAAPPGAHVVDDPDELRNFYAGHRAAHIYALVDLEAPFWPASRWYRRGDAVVGLIADRPDALLTAYAVSTRDPAESNRLLAELAPALPPGLLITGPVGLIDALEGLRAISWSGRHMRYALDGGVVLADPSVECEDLGTDAVPELLELYGIEPGAAFFLPPMVGDDTFVGIRRGGELAAAAGTHVVSEQQRVAAIGAVYVHPDHRGAGLGEQVTRGVLRRLRGRVDVIGLNVAIENAPARAIYERLGFEPILEYEEAELAGPSSRDATAH